MDLIITNLLALVDWNRVSFIYGLMTFAGAPFLFTEQILGKCFNTDIFQQHASGLDLRDCDEMAAIAAFFNTDDNG